MVTSWLHSVCVCVRSIHRRNHTCPVLARAKCMWMCVSMRRLPVLTYTTFPNYFTPNANVSVSFVWAICRLRTVRRRVRVRISVRKAFLILFFIFVFIFHFVFFSGCIFWRCDNRRRNEKIVFRFNKWRNTWELSANKIRQRQSVWEREKESEDGNNRYSTTITRTEINFQTFSIN